jgi:hypothetical protein
MTPIAFRLFRRVMSGAKMSTDERAFAMKRLIDVRYFEATEVAPLIFDLTKRLTDQWSRDRSMPKLQAFLPAPRTWIEYVVPDDPHFAKGRQQKADRGAFLFETHDDGHVSVTGMLKWPDGRVQSSAGFAEPNHPRAFFPLSSEDFVPETPVAQTFERQHHIYFEMHAMLAVINSPRVIEQESREPHRGLVREMRNANMPHKFTPWSVIKYSVTRAAIDAAGETGEHGGERCLHFVRAHTRWLTQQGRITLVTAHKRGNRERGDKTIGSTYTVSP